MSALWAVGVPGAGRQVPINGWSGIVNETKSTRNSGHEWSGDDIDQLRQLVDGNTPTRLIGLKLGRTEDAIRDKASELGLSLAPANQSPYGDMS
jgi:hypothetical protein